MATNLTPLIAQLMAERGQTQGAALSQIGLSLGQIPEQMSREREQAMREQQLALQTQMGGLQMQQMRRQEANAALVDRSKQAVSGFMNDPTMWNEDHTINVRAVQQRLSQPDATGQSQPYDLGTVYNTIDGINQSLGTARDQQLKFQEAKANARAKMAGGALMLGDQDGGNYFTHAQAMMAAGLKSGVFNQDEVHQQLVDFVEHPEAIKGTLQDYVNQSTAPPIKVGAEDTLLNPAYPSQVMAKGMGKQPTPLTPEEAALKRAQVKEIDAKLSGNTPMTEKDRATLAVQRGHLAEEIRRDNMANDPFGTIGLGAGTPVSSMGGAPAPGGVPPARPAPQAGGAAPAAVMTPFGPAPAPASAGAGAAPAAAGGRQAGAADRHGEDFLSTLPPPIAAQVKTIAEGRAQAPSGAAMRAVYYQRLMEAVNQYDPTFDAATGPARFALRKDLTSTSGKGGQSIGAINTAVEHAGLLSDLIEKEGNTNYPLINEYLINPAKTQMGATGVTNFQAAQPQLMKEIEKAWRGTGGSDRDIQELEKSLGKDKGIQQQREALGTFLTLLEGKVDSLEQQRDVLGPNAAKQIPILFDRNKPLIEKIRRREQGLPDPTPTPSVAPAPDAAPATTWVSPYVKKPQD